MKRISDLYKNIYNIENIRNCFNEVCRNTKSKSKVQNYNDYKAIYINRIYNILKNREYVVGPSNVFTIHEPKERRIVSQGMIDKTINHLVSRYILYPAILPCLLDVNVASRANMGTKEGLRLANEYHRKMKIKYGKYYILKYDVSKFFASIDKNILKQKLLKRIKDKDAIKIVFDIIDSEDNGLSIGSMTSQVLAIFYLNDLDHYIKEELKIKMYVRYQDDGLLFHHSKLYLKECLDKIESYLEKEKLRLNPKTRIYNSNNNFIFLGRNRSGKYSKYRNVKRKLKKKAYLYHTNKLNFNRYICSRLNYSFLIRK